MRISSLIIGKALLVAVVVSASTLSPTIAVAGDVPTPQLIYLEEAEEITLALSAAPRQMRQDATVFVFGRSGYAKRKQGTSNINCLVNRDGYQAGDTALRPTCWDAEGSATILPIALKVGELIAQGKNAKEISEVVEDGFRKGHFNSPRKAGIAYMLRGDIQIDPTSKAISKTTFPPHYMVYAPGVTNSDLGISTSDSGEPYHLPFIYAGYSGGARTAYLIVMARDKSPRSE